MSQRVLSSETCPRCGSPKLWRMGNMLRCDSCDTVSHVDEMQKSQKASLPDDSRFVSETRQPIDPRTVMARAYPIDVPMAITKIAILLVLSGVIIGFLYSTTQFNKYAAIDRRGQYVVPSPCFSEVLVTAEYGFMHQQPLLTVHPGIQGQDHWVVSPEVAAEIKQRLVSEKTYLRLSCGENIESYVFDPIPVPQDGQKVVLFRSNTRK